MYNRSHYEATLDARYGQRLNYLHAKLYGKINASLNFVNLISGTAAFGAFTSEKPNIILWIGVIISISSILSTLLSPATKSAEFADKSRQYAKLLVIAPELNEAELDKQIRQLQSDTTPIIEAIRIIAYNDNLRESGREDYLATTNIWQKLLKSIN